MSCGSGARGRDRGGASQGLLGCRGETGLLLPPACSSSLLRAPSCGAAFACVWAIALSTRLSDDADAMPDTPRTPPGRHAPGGSDAAWTDLGAAAARLGISPDAARKRLERGTLRGEKRGGHWLVWLPDFADQPDTPGRQADAGLDATSDATSGQSDATRTPSDAMAPTTRELIDQLKAENMYLRDQLEQRSRELATERERFDVLHREALARIPTLGAGQSASVASPEPAGATEPRHPAPDPSASPRPAHAPWWRRWLGLAR